MQRHKIRKNLTSPIKEIALYDWGLGCLEEVGSSPLGWGTGKGRLWERAEN